MAATARPAPHSPKDNGLLYRATDALYLLGAAALALPLILPFG